MFSFIFGMSVGLMLGFILSCIILTGGKPPRDDEDGLV